MPFVIDNSKSKKGVSVSEGFALFNCSKFDLPFLQNKDYQLSSKSSRYLEVELNATTTSA